MNIRTVLGLIFALSVIRAIAQAVVQETPNDITDIANLKNHGQAWLMYANDYDDRSLYLGWQCYDRATQQPAECLEYREGPRGELNVEGKELSPESRTAVYWMTLVHPYNLRLGPNPNNGEAFWVGSKNSHWFDAPDAKGTNVGLQNSYGYNALYLSPYNDIAGKPTQPTIVGSIERANQMIVFADSTFHIVAPDVQNDAKLQKLAKIGRGWTGSEGNFAEAQGEFVSEYWKNLGGSDWSYSYGVRSTGSVKLGPAQALKKVGSLSSSGTVYAVAIDGHVLRLSPSEIVGDICYWTSDRDGPHPGCLSK